MNRYGSKLSDNILEEVEAYIDGDIEVDLSETAPGACKDFLAGRNRYISYLTSVPMGSFRGYKVGLDLANGAASTMVDGRSRHAAEVDVGHDSSKIGRASCRERV